MASGQLAGRAGAEDSADIVCFSAVPDNIPHSEEFIKRAGRTAQGKSRFPGPQERSRPHGRSITGNVHRRDKKGRGMEYFRPAACSLNETEVSD